MNWHIRRLVRAHCGASRKRVIDVLVSGMTVLLKIPHVAVEDIDSHETESSAQKPVVLVSAPHS